jgi:pimeloyl-ACP methyl ester carboxylesterase
MKVRISFPSLFLTGLILAALPALSQPVTKKIAPVQGATEKLRSFSVTRVGHGRPMILIPGLLSSGDAWSSTVDHFKDRYECHVLTLAGFAGQPAIPAPFLQTVRDDVVKYIAEKKLDRPVIVGHSLGGFLAYWIAATAPDKVGPIVAVDGVPFIGALANPAATPETNRPMAEQMQKAYASFTKEQLASQSRMAVAQMITDPQQVEEATAWSAASDPATAGLAFAEMMTTDLRETVAAIRTPVLLIGAAGSPAAAYEAQVAKIPDHRVVMAEHGRHFVMLDEPAFLFSTMDSFLSGPAAGKKP